MRTGLAGKVLDELTQQNADNWVTEGNIASTIFVKNPCKIF